MGIQRNTGTWLVFSLEHKHGNRFTTQSSLSSCLPHTPMVSWCACAHLSRPPIHTEACILRSSSDLVPGAPRQSHTPHVTAPTSIAVAIPKTHQSALATAHLPSMDILFFCISTANSRYIVPDKTGTWEPLYMQHYLRFPFQYRLCCTGVAQRAV